METFCLQRDLSYELETSITEWEWALMKTISTFSGSSNPSGTSTIASTSKTSDILHVGR